MTAARADWAVAFLRQGRSDLTVYSLLTAERVQPVAASHSLHYLQMASEKIANAYLIRDTDVELHGQGGLLRRHVGFEKFTQALLLSPAIQANYRGRTAQWLTISKRMLRLLWIIEQVRFHRIGVGKGAELAGMAPAAFMRVLGAHGVPVIDYPAADLEHELSQLGLS